MSADRNEIARGAAQLAHHALREELKRLDKVNRRGVVVAPEQRALLAKWADQLQHMAVHAGEEPPDLFTRDAAPRGKKP